jgi:hypothetical protein
MLNPWLAVTFQAMRLGFEAQNAVALRLMRLVGAGKTEARGIIAEKAAAPPNAQKAATKAASDSGGRREAVTKRHKKRLRAKRRHSNNKKHSFRKSA